MWEVTDVRELKLVVPNPTGLHARPAARLASVSKGFESAISISANGRVANAKQVLGIMTLGAAQGSEVTIDIDGRDEEDAEATIRALFAANLDE